MLPAFKILLSEKDLQLLGEIAAIQGQVDYLINEVTAKVLGLPLATAEQIYGRAALGSKIDQLILYATNSKEPPDLIEILEEIRDVAKSAIESRNAYAHAFYGYTYPGQGKGRTLVGQSPNGKNTITMYLDIEAAPNDADFEIAAFRSSKAVNRKPVHGLEELRDDFALLSQLVAFIYGKMLPIREGFGPWREKPSQESTQPHKVPQASATPPAKGPQSPPQS